MVVAIIALAGVLTSAATAAITSYFVADKTSQAQSDLATESSVRAARQSAYVSYFQEVNNFDIIAASLTQPPPDSQDVGRVQEAQVQLTAKSFDVELAGSPRTRELSSKLLFKSIDMTRVASGFTTAYTSALPSAYSLYASLYRNDPDSFEKLEDQLKDSMRSDLGIVEK